VTGTHVGAAKTAGFEIVRAGAEHLDFCVPLFNAYRQFYKLPSNEAAARRFLHARLVKGEAVIFLALECAGAGPARRVLGFTLLYPTFSSLSMRPWWTLNDLYVVPAARQRGVARALLERARLLATETGASGLGLETAADNLPAQKLYEQFGWHRDTQSFRYELKV